MKNREINKLNTIIAEKNKEIELFKKIKGSQCSINGSNYEKEIHSIVKNCNINQKPFNTQKTEELAGSSSKNDIECNFIVEKDIGIEVKKVKHQTGCNAVLNIVMKLKSGREE